MKSYITEEKGIESYQFYDHLPANSSQLNTPGRPISIDINNQDIKTFPHKSLLLIRGQLIVKNATNVVLEAIDTSTIDFVNNGLLSLFSKITYSINSTEIDTIDNPGVTTTMKGLASFSNDLALNNAGWQIKNGDSVINDKGYFSVSIPLSTIMGFFEDHKSFIFRINQKLELIRSNDDRNCLLFENSIVGHTFEIQINEIIWRMPHIKFSIDVEQEINKKISSNTNFNLYFRNWKYFCTSSVPTIKEYTWRITTTSAKPRYFLIGFQTKRNNNLKKNQSEFDLCKLENIQVNLNTTKYPSSELRLNLEQNKCDLLYNMFLDFKNSYYGQNDHNLPIVDYKTFLTTYPIMIVDTSKQNEVIKEAVIDIKIDFKWNANFPADTIIHCLILSDDSFSYNPLTNQVMHTQV
jgi:hypothetical protein